MLRTKLIEAENRKLCEKKSLPPGASSLVAGVEQQREPLVTSGSNSTGREALNRFSMSVDSDDHHQWVSFSYFLVSFSLYILRLRLELLGDKLLSLVVTELIIERYPHLKVGKITVSMVYLFFSIQLLSATSK